MQEQQNPKKESGRKRRFITEKVVRQPLTRGQILKYMIVLILAAALFGAVAAVSFVAARPLADRYLGEEETEESPSVSIPKDEIAETTTVAPTTSEPPSETEPIEEMVESAVRNYRYSIDDVVDLYGSLREQMQQVRQSIVVVHSVQEDVDWFDNPVETTGLYSGAIIAATTQELMILTPDEAVEQADSIRVAFVDGNEVDGRMKQRDSLSGMAVVSVKLEDLAETTKEIAQPLVLGNSYMVQEGDLVMAVGAPAGIVRSLDYGLVSCLVRNVQMTDQLARVLYVHIHADDQLGTFLVNTNGELIGWAMSMEEDDVSTDMAKVMGISDYKGILENLTNGLGAPCFGVKAQEVTETMGDQGLPSGIYVLNAVADRPAYKAGIQNGDVITAIDDREIVTMKDFLSVMDDLSCGQLVNVAVQRYGREYYTELEFQVTIEAR
ncbi:MAG: S1C family serine protease [Clostridiales bacterium]|nr:S1C family serine protease [Clostridiales bacterium]